MAMLASKNGGIVLPYDVVHEMLMKYCDHETLCSTRALQSTRVQRCTQFGDMEKAIKAGNLDNVKWIARNDEWKKKGDDLLALAAAFGHLDCLKWLFHAQGRSFEEADFLYFHASIGGHLKICVWLKKNECPLTSDSFNEVIETGNMEVAEWCLQDGCVFNDDTFECGAHSGKIEVLEWLKLNDCPWGILSLQEVDNHQDVNSGVINSGAATWLLENGCPVILF